MNNLFEYFLFQICFFTGGWIFFVKQLFRDYEVRHVSVQLIFSSTFALSLTMFELIIFEIIGLLESSSRYFHWRLELTLILFMLIALIPFYIAYSSISNISFGNRKSLYDYHVPSNQCIISLFSTTKMDCSINIKRLDCIFIWILANW